MYIAQIEKLSQPKDSFIDIEGIKHFLRLDGGQDDTLVQGIANGVISEIERKTNFVLAESDWRLKIANFSGNYAKIPKKNVKKICKVTIEFNDQIRTLDSSEYRFVDGVLNFRCILCTKTLSIYFTAGCKAAKDMDPEMYIAMKQRVASLYEGKNSQHDFFEQFKEYKI